MKQFCAGMVVACLALLATQASAQISSVEGPVPTGPGSSIFIAAVAPAITTAFGADIAAKTSNIVYNGLSDQGMASSVLADWYDQVIRDNGKSIRESVRLFLVPGMTHCDGGRAADQFDMLEAIMAWVEEGRAPDRIKATGKAFPGASRPICPYPLVARYKGGDVNNADSFTCTK